MRSLQKWYACCSPTMTITQFSKVPYQAYLSASFCSIHVDDGKVLYIECFFFLFLFSSLLFILFFPFLSRFYNVTHAEIKLLCCSLQYKHPLLRHRWGMLLRLSAENTAPSLHGRTRPQPTRHTNLARSPSLSHLYPSRCIHVLSNNTCIWICT